MNSDSGSGVRLELAERATRLLSSAAPLDAALLATAVVGGPRQEVLDPSALDSTELCSWLREATSTGANRVLDPALGTNVVLLPDAIELRQGPSGLRVDVAGGVRVLELVRVAGGRPGRRTVDWADLRDGLHRALRLAAQVLDRIDPAGRLSQVAAAASVVGADVGRRPAVLPRSSVGVVALGYGPARTVATLTPPVRAREALRSGQLAEELSERLGMQHDGPRELLPDATAAG